MASRDELYAKFGITAEAAQLFETQLGTLLLCARGRGGNWHFVPDSETARDLLREIDRSTLGGLLAKLKHHVSFDDDHSARFSSARAARNKLNHGFYERHNFKIQTDEGRDDMVTDLEALHQELFQAWQVASTMTSLATEDAYPIIHLAAAGTKVRTVHKARSTKRNVAFKTQRVTGEQTLAP